jgi:hypothetical protein
MSRFPFLPAPDRRTGVPALDGVLALDGGAVLPAALALLLGLGIAAQLALGSGEAPVPESVGIAGLARRPVPAVPPARVPASLAGRALFLPSADAGSATAGTTGAAPAEPSFGAVVAGSVARRGRRAAVLLLPDGSSRYLLPGQGFAGWQLLAITQSAARFRRAGRDLTLGFGAAAPAPAEAPAEALEEPQ